ncbi:GNAT family N-acetyltransferase [Vibrio sp. SCSIO 43136]|uniref:GNAT family N-acetyltransferase n=1 Tax=Vibrio sp. SCSIO 43136 TaxID=2819101 RepID=UPI002074AC59|nr:GNAT family N-acetyltransferase [Vibrio sp. SCSIO 43136]USD64062.1 GNAT family N-acetyltransferase [Vibrio sp. SCSIO 43136]
MKDISIEQGWSRVHAIKVAQLYEEAFGRKFLLAIPSRAQRIEILAKSFQPDFSFVAIKDGRIVGLAGFNVTSGSLTGGIDAQGLINHLGLWSGLRACAIFGLYERAASKNQLVMDGIAVESDSRGAGIGSLLLDAIIAYATQEGYQSVRLDVIDSNPRAKRLYETKGFVATKVEHFPYLKWLLGFSGSTTMLLKLDSKH